MFFLRKTSKLCYLFAAVSLVQLNATGTNKPLSFSKNIETRSFAVRSHSMGVGYMQQSYLVNAQLEGTSGYPNYQLQIRPIVMDVRTQHVFLQFAGLGPASFYDFWLGYKTVLGYAFTATAGSAQAAYPITIGSAYFSHQQMLGYYVAGMRLYSMLGLTSDWFMKADMKSGDEKLNKVGPDGIFAHSGGGVFVRFGPIVLNAEVRIPVWRANNNRQTGLHALFSVSYEIFG